MGNKVDLSPRGQCLDFMARQNAEPILLSKAEFDGHAKQRDFEKGPFRDKFGEGYGDPYNPYIQAFGELRDGRFVYCELHPELQEEVGERLSELNQT